MEILTSLIKDGEILKQNMFATLEGTLRISIILYKYDIYFLNELDGKVVEIVNITEQCRKKHNTNITTRSISVNVCPNGQFIETENI